jgi:outer membrane protein TolC
MSEEQADREFELFEVGKQVELTEIALAEAMTRYQQVERRGEAGLVHESELRKARFELMELNNRLEFLRLKLRTLGGGET